jgi:hypothetical protein
MGDPFAGTPDFRPDTPFVSIVGFVLVIVWIIVIRRPGK